MILSFRATPGLFLPVRHTREQDITHFQKYFFQGEIWTLHLDIEDAAAHNN